MYEGVDEGICVHLVQGFEVTGVMSLCCQDNELARFLRYVSGSLLKSSMIG